MAIDAAAALVEIAAEVAEITGLRVYSQGHSGDHADRLNPGNLETPCAIVIMGPTIDYLLTAPQHVRTYEVNVDVVFLGADYGERAYNTLVLTQQIIEKFVVNVKLGGVVTKCLFRRASGLMGITYQEEGPEYTGERITLEVQEHAMVTAAVGG